jgi:hypothetical protein
VLVCPGRQSEVDRYRYFGIRGGHHVILSWSTKRNQSLFGIGIELTFTVFGRISTLSTGFGNGIQIGIGRMSILFGIWKRYWNWNWNNIGVIEYTASSEVLRSTEEDIGRNG